MRSLARPLLCSTLLLMSLPSAIAQAQQAAELRAVALYGQADDALVLQLEGELRTMGYRVILMERSQPLAASDFSARSARQAFDAAIEIPAGERSAIIWILASTPRRIKGPASPAGQESRIIALRIIETLRVAWQDHRSTPKRKATPPPDSPKTTKPPAPRRPALQEEVWIARGLMLGLAGVLGAGIDGPGARMQLATVLGYAFTPRWALLSLSSLPLYTQKIDDAAGELQITTAQTSLALEYTAGAQDAALRFPLALGLGLGWTWFEGRARAPFEGRGDRLLTPLLQVRAQIAYQLGPRLSMEAGASASWFLLEHRIFADDRLILRRGRPALQAGVGIRWAFGSKER